MGDIRQRHPITLKRFVLRLEGMDTVPVRRDIAYRAVGRVQKDPAYDLTG